MIREIKFSKVRESQESRKSGNFILSEEKNDILKESQGKLKQFNSTNLIPLKVGRNIWVHCDVLNEEEKFVENVLVL